MLFSHLNRMVLEHENYMIINKNDVLLNSKYHISFFTYLIRYIKHLNNFLKFIILRH